ncbi:indolepyruvate ferredoxin oxidoreductase family protein [Hyphomonas chukchiensis]|uniref:Indolepyruvate ferredoxin oxidoreductase n=1 Tax=Hyphomonas chukchiensis TaxID=1280947 RepID=A0A062UN37_9PROT|nr:indolepyruvate ferredoxin oxidoreductase family protein [Hyphomonas chukchiensis]KCZ58707.1 hypothetical protein HY30_15995 [Hyphomonas chukchiensis]
MINAGAPGHVSLDDKYKSSEGRIYLTGIQALVRLPLIQRSRDKANGLNTGGFISGYRGSPLGGYDQALWAAKKLLEAENIHFEPGVNEELAATAVWGSQQVNLFPGAKVDGVFGIWYGKAPGVDRSLDALKHANSAGTSSYGGVLAILGDDHGGVSSTLVNQSEQVMIAAMIPVINPSSVQEYVDFGLMGFALSRYSGCWVGFKAVAETVESSASISVDPERVTIVLPTDFVPPEGGLGIRSPDPTVEQERRLVGAKLKAVAAFARANPFDRSVWNSPGARLGVVTTGKAYLDVRQAMSDLGIDEARARELGISIYKVGMTWPLETEGIKRFVDGLEEVVVVEEKRSLIEDQLMKALCNLPRRPIVVGKLDELGRELLPETGELDPLAIGLVLADRILRISDDAAVRAAAGVLADLAQPTSGQVVSLTRTPFFCSGCPHNTSTNLPEGSRAGAGIGCHGMAMFVPEKRTSTITQMGGEGANWIGQAPFSGDEHIFQNLGDGTYNHSGLLAVRAAAASNVNITYKILYNDAVAMTGGQPHDAPLTVPQITRQVSAEGAKKIYIVTDEPDKYGAGAEFAPGTVVRHRDDLDTVQKDLREVRGLTVLIYDQTCAAEKRRRRKRGLYPDPPKRIFINDRVCEGCGDCSVKSNCVAVKPLETEYGRKRQIDQSDCNKDYSCANGFCPSFVTVFGGDLRKAPKAQVGQGDELFAEIPFPSIPVLDQSYDILITGIGGTGVITVGALLGMAAHMDGLGCSVLDNTGFAQKNGAVMSHVRLGPDPEELHSVRIGRGRADLLIGCDIVVAGSQAALSCYNPETTRAVVNEHLQPTSDFVRDNDMDFQTSRMRQSLAQAIGGNVDFVNATAIASALMGDAIATNVFMLGYAWQKGLVPLRLSAIEQAIELNGVAIQANKETFAWGRLAAHDPEKISALLKPSLAPEQDLNLSTQAMVDRRALELEVYQDRAYADRYRALADAACAADPEGAFQGQFSRSVATNFYKLMAYKDEYEVARLYSAPEFREKLRQQFQGDFKLKVHLAPPLFSRRDKATGQLKKRMFGPWMFRVFPLLAKLKILRGTWADPFGHTDERRTERALVDEYEALIKKLLANLTDNYSVSCKLADVPSRIRGYGHVKDESIRLARERQRELIVALDKKVSSIHAVA